MASRPTASDARAAKSPLRESDILRHIAREEPLTATMKAFPGLSRERLARMLERMAAISAELPTGAAEVAGPLARLRVYSDGAARGNPGPAGAGAVLVEPSGQVVDRLGKYLGVQTNNYAEYMGLLLGLRRARELGVREVEVFADSELMIRQLGGRYQVKSPTLRPLYEEALRLLNDFSRVKLVHVPREMNTAADEMSNRAIDEKL
ncbi:MAG: ribonuclease HI family protein [Myxococcales bacterium]|nr:ribonuclease HI family protein [Myxococcales bacterium]